MSAFSFLNRKAAEGPGTVDIADAGKVILPNSPEGRKFFRKRSIFIVLLALGFIAINALSGAAVEFDFVSAVLDFPSAVVWMATNFVPTVEALEKNPANSQCVTFHYSFCSGIKCNWSNPCLRLGSIGMSFGRYWWPCLAYRSRNCFAVS